MSFDTLAPWYRSMEAVTAGGILQRCRTTFLAQAKECRCALLLGEGPGRFLVELLRVNPYVTVTCVEQSPRMIEEARRELKRSGLDAARVRFEPCDILNWRPERVEFDLVVTHFFLDCFQRRELEELVAIVASSTTADAVWLLADFRLPATGWQRWRARAVLTLLYAFFRVTTGLSASRLTPPDEFLEGAGFRLAGRRLVNCGLTHSDLWSKVRA